MGTIDKGFGLIWLLGLEAFSILYSFCLPALGGERAWHGGLSGFWSLFLVLRTVDGMERVRRFPSPFLPDCLPGSDAWMLSDDGFCAASGWRGSRLRFWKAATTKVRLRYHLVVTDTNPRCRLRKSSSLAWFHR